MVKGGRVAMEKAKAGSGEFDFLIEEARRLGALESKLITPDRIVVENRVLLKCQYGCDSYGHKFICPPYTPTPDEFRKILKEYGSILVVKFPAHAEAREDVGRSLLKNQFGPDAALDVRERTRKFWDTWNDDKKRILLAMLDLEKTAFNRGYTLAFALTAGACSLCEKCNLEGACTHPTMARFSEHAVGVNVNRTLEKIGMSVRFPFETNPEGIGMLLID
jgi:predicted metal-binding protein